MLSILVPKKHPGKNFPQICSLKKLKALLLFQAIKLNPDCKIHALKRNKQKLECIQLLRYVQIILCLRNTWGKIPTDLQLKKA